MEVLNVNIYFPFEYSEQNGKGNFDHYYLDREDFSTIEEAEGEMMKGTIIILETME